MTCTLAVTFLYGLYIYIHIYSPVLAYTLVDTSLFNCITTSLLSRPGLGGPGQPQEGHRVLLPQYTAGVQYALYRSVYFISCTRYCAKYTSHSTDLQYTLYSIQYRVYSIQYTIHRTPAGLCPSPRGPSTSPCSSSCFWTQRVATGRRCLELGMVRLIFLIADIITDILSGWEPILLWTLGT